MRYGLLVTASYSASPPSIINPIQSGKQRASLHGDVLLTPSSFRYIYILKPPSPHHSFSLNNSSLEFSINWKSVFRIELHENYGALLGLRWDPSGKFLISFFENGNIVIFKTANVCCFFL